MADQAKIDHDAEHKERERRGKSERRRSPAEPEYDQQRHIHAEHDELAMREIDEVHHPPDQRQPGGEQRIDRPEQQTADDDLDEEHEAGLSTVMAGHSTSKTGVNRPYA